MVDSLVTPPSASGVGINTMIGAASTTSEADEMAYFDPKLMHAATKESILRSRQQQPQDVMLFVIGGGNYVEYQNLVDYGKRKKILNE
ncbi:unnamed protein product [Caenorhabditis auriculariae]|uniref:Uncharacterized protein n=1 Tax=Caenorhabditis auriculariae TaxID=2777116 RepID=A0A8S1HLK9_9PELO|nr:unnamed protein product [Caenorhabditis auriculariae]